MPSHRFQILLTIAAALLIIGLGATSQAQPQEREEWKGKNLQYFPEDIARDELIGHMRQFSFALGVACTHCHGTAEQTGFNLKGVDFSLDSKPTKSKAREMLQMTEQINTALLAPITSSALDLQVSCFTCHSGLALPEAIESRVLRLIESDGLEAAIADYRNIRQDHHGGAAYNFKEQPLVEVAASLHNQGQFEASIAVCRLNLEFHHESGQTKYQLAETYFALGDTKNARPFYEKMLEARPGSRRAKARLEEIERMEAGAGNDNSGDAIE